jgi:hypothetical protein
MAKIIGSVPLDELKAQVAISAFGRVPTEGLCVQCGTDEVKPENFKDDISRREFSITHFCQKC